METGGRGQNTVVVHGGYSVGRPVMVTLSPPKTPYGVH